MARGGGVLNMVDLQNDDVRADLAARGYSRRAIGRVFSLLAAGAAGGPLGAPAAHSPTRGGTGPEPQAEGLVRAHESWGGPPGPGAAGAGRPGGRGRRQPPPGPAPPRR